MYPLFSEMYLTLVSLDACELPYNLCPHQCLRHSNSFRKFRCPLQSAPTFLPPASTHLHPRGLVVSVAARTGSQSPSITGIAPLTRLALLTQVIVWTFVQVVGQDSSWHHCVAKDNPIV